MIIEVPTDYLLSITNPLEFDVWGCGPITLEMVADADHVEDQWNPDDDWQVWSAEEHAGRIHFLADQEELVPIGLDVGVPCLGYDSQKVTDGHHRIVAAVYRGDLFISCEITGQVDYIDELVTGHRKVNHEN